MFEEEVEVTLAETGSPFHSSQVRSLLIFKHLVLDSKIWNHFTIQQYVRVAKEQKTTKAMHC